MRNKPPGLLQSVNNEWLRKIEAARKAREPWKKTADICTNFYQGSVDFMWGDEFRRQYFSNIPCPKFKITIAKSFEFVALVGPTIIWDYADRCVRPFQDIEITPEVFGDDPAMAQEYEAMMEEYRVEKNKNLTRCSLLQSYLNYAQQEQPDGGLVGHSLLAVTDALVTGRGCLWEEPYKFPGSDRVLTGAFFEKSDRLFIDANSRKPDFSDAKWIARQHIDYVWEVERRFGYKEGALRHGGLISADEQTNYIREDGLANNQNQIVWYEVFSKCGVGTRDLRGQHPLHATFESEIGDYAYVCVTKGLSHPLNCKNDVLDKDVEEVKKSLSWPVPYYKDNRWPVATLDFYPRSGSPWPIAPIAPGLGELIFLNVLISCLAGRVWENSRNIRGILKQAGEEAIRAFKSNDYDVTLEFNEQVTQNIKELVSYVEAPSANTEVFALIDRISLQFDKRVGLPDFMYGMNQGGKISRTAADVNAKEQATSVRPEYMKRCVEKWQGEVANLDRICAGWNVTGRDIEPLLGKTGARLWDMMIAGEDPETYVRNMKCTIVADSTTRPNKDKEFEGLIQMAQYLGPTMQMNAQATGDYTAWNEFVKELGRARGIDTSKWVVPNTPPPQPEQPMPEQPMSQEQAMPPEVDPMMQAMPQEQMVAQMPQEQMVDPMMQAMQGMM